VTASRRVGRALVATILAAGLFAGFAGSSSAALRGRKFQTKSDDIGCLFARGSLRCDIEGGLRPEPKRDCEFDWAAIGLDADGKARPLCVSDTVRDSDAPTLRPGRKWRRAGIVCRAKRASLRCRNEKDHGFFLSGDDWDTF
jgi:hypothetical protein